MKRTILLFAASLMLTAASAQKNKVPAAVIDDNGVVDLTGDSISKANTARPVPGSTHKDDRPVMFYIGDSTMRNGTLGNGNNGQWGWDSQAYSVFDADKIVVANCAKAGRSTRSFLNEGRWEKVYNALQPGDFVIIEFGHNDQAPINKKPYRGTIRESKDTAQPLDGW